MLFSGFKNEPGTLYRLAGGPESKHGNRIELQPLGSRDTQGLWIYVSQRRPEPRV
jgi:hypothetical protein